MQRGFQVTILGVLLCLSTGTAFGKDPFKVDTDQPKDFEAIKEDMKKLEDYLGDIQCGGWNGNQHVPGTVSMVTGVPGRYGQWDGAIQSGMATRFDGNGNKNINDDYRYPATDAFTTGAKGFTTACTADKSEIKKTVWREGGALPGQVIQVDITYPHPKFEDPSCRWRVKDADGNFVNSAPHIPLDDTEPALSFEQLSEGTNRNPPGDRQSPPLCTEFCNYLNTWQYKDCLSVAEATDPTDPTIKYSVCTEWGKKYLCTDQKVDDTKVPAACAAETTEWSNSRTCEGDRCRCMQLAQDINPGTIPPTPILGCLANPGNGLPDESTVYYSYYRHYLGNFTRDKIVSIPATDDNSRSNVPVACYGFYKEFDPLFHKTQPEDRRCVINIDVKDMRESQKGKGLYGQTSNMDDKDPLEVPNQRTKPATATDVWYLKLGWGFSLLKEEEFQNKYDRNLSSVYLDTDSMDRAKITGSWPIDYPTNPPSYALSDALHSFDDTGTGRILVSWWQKQQTEVATLLHPPVVRLIMPPGYAFGADPNNPIFIQQNSSSSSSMDSDDKRTKSIEIQLDATDDILGTALNAVQRSFLLHIEEDPVPVLIPMGSPTEFRARAEEWCVWHMRKTGEKNCTKAPEKVKKLMEKLNEYADDIEHVRELRAELATYAGKVMGIQQSLTKPISKWVQDNLKTYQDYLNKQKAFARVISKSWRETQEAMTTYQDKTNLPWCMNQRFETPIFSLLDDWLPSRNGVGILPEGTITADLLPNIAVPRMRDIIIDFSGITYMTGSIKLPVLKPVQVRLTIPSPTDISPDDKQLDTPLPDLPSIADIHTAIENAMKQLPKVQTGATYKPLDLPAMDDAKMNEAFTKILQIKDVIKKMDDRYDKFWKSIGPLNTQDIDRSRDGIPEMKEREECKSWNDDTCQHVEMDLIERFQRIGSRKMVLLNEDFLSIGVKRRSPTHCQPGDQICMLLHGERPEPAYIWQINAPKNVPDTGAATRDAVRESTFPDPLGTVDEKDFPLYDVNINDILPVFDVPKAIDLRPPKP